DLRSPGQEYRAITYNEDSQFTIIGVEDDTHVEITPTAQTEGGRPAGVPFSITLQRGEVYQVRSPGDLTGSRITTKIPENSTCKKIAVYRSEERRVGKESRSRWAAAQSGKIQMRAAETC